MQLTANAYGTAQALCSDTSKTSFVSKHLTHWLMHNLQMQDLVLGGIDALRVLRHLSQNGRGGGGGVCKSHGPFCVGCWPISKRNLGWLEEEAATAAGTFRPTAGGCRGGLSQTVFDPAAAGPAPEGY